MSYIYVANPVEAEAKRIASVGTVDKDGKLFLSLEDGTIFYADAGMIARMIPKVGDYVVTQLADGYTYLNPKEVFERKYHPKGETK